MGEVCVLKLGFDMLIIVGYLISGGLIDVGYLISGISCFRGGMCLVVVS